MVAAPRAEPEETAEQRLQRDDLLLQDISAALDDLDRLDPHLRPVLVSQADGDSLLDTAAALGYGGGDRGKSNVRRRRKKGVDLLRPLLLRSGAVLTRLGEGEATDVA